MIGTAVGRSNVVVKILSNLKREPQGRGLLMTNILVSIMWVELRQPCGSHYLVFALRLR
jgi:hypothetical protein